MDIELAPQHQCEVEYLKVLGVTSTVETEIFIRVDSVKEYMIKSSRYVPLSEKLSPMESVKAFARILTTFIGEYSSCRIAEFEKFLGVKMENISATEEEYEAYERQQAIFAINKFVKNECEVVKTVNLDDEDGSIAPVYEQVRIGRNEYEKLLISGEIFLTWKKTRIIVYLYFQGSWTRKLTLFYRTKDAKQVNGFGKKFRTFMQKHNLYKGEKLIYLPRNEFDFLEYPELGWNDVVLKDEIKEEIDLNITFMLDNAAECLCSGIPWRRGLIFGGIAGTGKTQVCRILCNKVPKGVTVIWATPKALYEANTINTLFEAARYFQPTLLIIEDIDFIGKDRSIDDDDVLGELLTQLDGNDPNHGLFIVATTNRPQMLDLALANRPSRFDVKVDFNVPEDEERKKLIKLFTKKMEFESPLNYGKISLSMNGLTGAHIKEIFVYAQLKALKRGMKKIKPEDVSRRARFYKTNTSRMVV